MRPVLELERSDLDSVQLVLVLYHRTIGQSKQMNIPIKVFQTPEGNRVFFQLKDEPLFLVIAYDVITSEFIKASRLFNGNGPCTMQSGTGSFGDSRVVENFDLRKVIRGVYPDGSVSNVRKARLNFKKHFVDGLVQLLQKTESWWLDSDMPTTEVPFLFSKENGLLVYKNNTDIFDFSLFPTAIYRLESKTVPSPADMPPVLYRPHRQCRTAKCFVYNRAMVLHFKMNEPDGTRTTLIPLRSFPSWFQIPGPKNWRASKGRWVDGEKMWLTEAIKKPLEAYKLFSVEGPIHNSDGELCIQITKTF